MNTEHTIWKDVVKFHGHICMGLAMGYRVAEAALEYLGSDRDIDEELVALVENDTCAVDAVQYVTGCTLGKGNLIFRDYGKPVYTFALRPGGKAVRIVPGGVDEARFPDLGELHRKVLSGETSEGEKERFHKLMTEAIEEFINLPLEEAVTVEKTTILLPEKARIFNSLTCSSCGEQVMEPRARVKDGQPVCIPCADHYER